MARSLPELRIDRLEQLQRLWMPGPAQVENELLERLKRLGQDRAYGESPDGLHVARH
jgi:hypothetical protein